MYTTEFKKVILTREKKVQLVMQFKDVLESKVLQEDQDCLVSMVIEVDQGMLVVMDLRVFEE